MGDTGNALLAAIAIAMALYHRERTGEGQAVSTSIVNAGLLHTSYAYIRADGSAADWGHVDAGQYGLSPYYRLYRCAPGDEWVFLGAVTPEQRSRLHELVPAGPAAPSADEKVDEDAVAAWLGSYFEHTTATEATRALDEAGVPVERVEERFCRDLFDDPEAKRLGLVSTTHSASVGRFEDPGLLVELSPASGVVQRGPCACGEHTAEILGELGYSDGEIAALLECRAALAASGAEE
jgi:crotonobetainyl-CoA:carnitine CoA-transferase CaiB-like acyl-CoA transferase